MKTIWQYIAIAALAVSAAACTPEYPLPSQAGLPQASDLDVTITVDQETNYVTFVMNNKGVVPVWIFGDQKIDGRLPRSTPTPTTTSPSASARRVSTPWR